MMTMILAYGVLTILLLYIFICVLQWDEVTGIFTTFAWILAIVAIKLG